VAIVLGGLSELGGKSFLVAAMLLQDLRGEKKT